MKPELRFETKQIMCDALGSCASVPDLCAGLIVQNDLEFCLAEDDEIFEGYGKRLNAYPYRQYLSYAAVPAPRECRTAVLENDFLRAVFLPEFGGRLWELYDKTSGRNLLYTNDIIRFRNLAVRSAWFSGGVEWNIGIIGHTPFTCEPLYTAQVTDSDGNPVLRMYEYERIRGVEYQMDFWLGQDDVFLNCRMRIANTSKRTVPMYWWSNIAVPEYSGGRIAVPAHSAFSSDMRRVYRTKIPVADGTDISFYNDIPFQVDYFFDIPRAEAKWIAHVDSGGYGLLHVSTDRLQSRKLFSWGHTEGAANWQRFLTENAGPYLEIQAGLGKTQYGCIPMAAHTAWEWLERYGAVSVDRAAVSGSYDGFAAAVRDVVDARCARADLERLLAQRKPLALTRGSVVQTGGGSGALEAVIRTVSGDRPLSAHLDYVFANDGQKEWAAFLHSGIVPQCGADTPPKEFVCEPVLYERLQSAVNQKENAGNWYAHYTLALLHAYYERPDLAVREMDAARNLSANAWTCHGSAALCTLCAPCEASGSVSAYAKAGIALRAGDIGYVKDMFKILLILHCERDITALYKLLPADVQSESRIRFDYLYALCRTGQKAQAAAVLTDDFVLDDLRECEPGISDVWHMLHGAAAPVPAQWDFKALS